MAELDKRQVLRTVFACVKKYDEMLCNRNLLFVCTDKYKRISCIEVSFDKSKFQHLTGCNTDKSEISALDFYERCMDQRLSVDDFELEQDGTAQMKMNVLPLMMTKNLSANSIGDYIGGRPKLITDKLAGGVKGCMGFLATGKKGRLVPNTLLEEDIRKLTKDALRIIITYRKFMTDAEYSEIVHVAKRVEWEKIIFPEEYSYLPMPEAMKKSSGTNKGK